MLPADPPLVSPSCVRSQSNLGANAILAVSMAVCRAGAASMEMCPRHVVFFLHFYRLLWSPDQHLA